VFSVAAFYEDYHQQIFISFENLNEILFGPKIDVSLMIDVGLVAQIIILHIFVSIKYSLVKKRNKQVLLSPELYFIYVRQASVWFDPSFKIVY